MKCRIRCRPSVRQPHQVSFAHLTLEFWRAPPPPPTARGGGGGDDDAVALIGREGSYEILRSFILFSLAARIAGYPHYYFGPRS